jgi:hypothetical protein
MLFFLIFHLKPNLDFGASSPQLITPDAKNDKDHNFNTECMCHAADLLGPYVCVERGLSTRVGKAWMMTDRHTRRRVCVESECNFTTQASDFLCRGQ